MRKALERVEQGDLDVEVPVDDGSEMGLLEAGFNRMAAGLRERERLHDLFGRHVGRDVARAALEREADGWAAVTPAAFEPRGAQVLSG
jgi:adenylate cyclase